MRVEGMNEGVAEDAGDGWSRALRELYRIERWWPALKFESRRLDWLFDA